MMVGQSSIEVLISIEFGSDGMNMLIQTIETLSSLFDDLKRQVDLNIDCSFVSLLALIYYQPHWSCFGVNKV
jgi:hypothetical protein